MKRLIGTLLTTLMIAVCSLAHATFIVDTGAGSPGNTGGNSLYSGQWLAGEFSTSQAYTITAVQGWIGGGSGTATVAIYSDGGNVPGSELYAAGFTVDTITNAWYGASGLSWALGAGTYWAAFEVRAGDTLNGWMLGDVLSPLANYSFTSGGVWNYVSGVNVGVRVIPEPGTLALIGIALLGLFVSRRRKI